MISPFTGGNAKLMTEESTLKYRNEVFAYTRYYYVCEDTGIRFTDAEVDDRGLKQVHEQYRQRHGIPSADKIRSIRKKYNLPAICLSKILGLGENQYRLYEAGDMPTEQIGKMISTIEKKDVMLEYVKASANTFSKDEYIKVLTKVLSSVEPASYPINSSARYSSFSCESQLYRINKMKINRPRWSPACAINSYCYGYKI